MTKVGEIIQKEIINAKNKAREETLKELAKKMMQNGEDGTKIMIYTGFTSEQIDEIEETIIK